jgi:monooxygenase
MDVVVYNGQRRISRQSFDSNLRPYMADTNVTLGVGDNITLGVSITDITDEIVDLSWTYTRPPKGENDPLLAFSEKRAAPPLLLEELSSLGNLGPGFSTIYDTESVKGDKLFRWAMRSLLIPQDDLIESAQKGVVFIGDAVHPMPIFAGEGGNHAILDGVVLAEQLEPSERVPVDAITAFYNDNYERWKQAVDGSNKRFFDLHRPLETWRKLAGKE